METIVSQFLWAEIIKEILIKFFSNFLPKLLGGIILVIIGWFVAIIVAKIIAILLKKIKLDLLFERTGWGEALEKAEIHLKPSDFLAAIGKWFIFIVFLIGVAETFGLNQFAFLLQKLVSWIPQLIVAVGIFFVAIVLADFLAKIVRASTEKMHLKNGQFLASITRWGIFILAIFAILLQLGIMPTIINSIVFGIVFALSLAFGLAFGLGGKEIAAKLLEDWKKESRS
jgi:MFS family permease